MEIWIRKNAPFRFRIFVGLVVSLLLLGCATERLEKVSAASAGRMQELSIGTVVAVKMVKIDGKVTYLGPSTGAIIGSGIGQTVGHGSGQILATAGAAALGGVVGGIVETQLSAKRAQELTISVDGGETVVVVQQLNNREFVEGDRVRVIHSFSGDARVSDLEYESDNPYLMEIL